MDHNTALQEIVIQAIQQAPHQRLTFAQYMELALYHPEHGYYCSQSEIIGPGGDFVTSSHLGVDFGELMAAQFVDIWHRLDNPVPFHLIEMGAGAGQMAADVLECLQHHHRDCFNALEYRILEASMQLRSIQKQRLAPWQGRVHWHDLTDIPEESITGCWFSNEFFDALPVHQVVVTTTGLQEICLAPSTEPPGWQEVQAPLSTPRLEDYFRTVGIDICSYDLGYRTEVNLTAMEWLKAIAQRLKRGFVITIDYGYPAHRYYSPSRNQGTLQCYYQHQHHSDPYQYLGHQDITAHVDFTALQSQGEQWGLASVGSTPQAMFLMALGLGDRLAQLGQIETTDTVIIQEAIRRREALHQLINPMGLGNFTVLIQSKGIPPSQTRLRGLQAPFP